MIGSAAQKIKTEENQLARFLRIHYQTDGEHQGCVHLHGVRSDGIFQRLIYATPEEMEKKLAELDPYNRRRPYYLTANTYKAGVRQLEHLFSFHNIVIDIDGHKVPEQELPHKIEALRFFILEDLVPDPEFYTPNTITKTGRGLQLWWALDQMAAATERARRVNGGHVQTVREYLIGKLEELIQGHGAVLEGMEIDRGASGNLAGLFRLPGSYNQRSHRFGSFEIISEETLNAYETAREIRKERAGDRRKKKSPAPAAGRVLTMPKSDASTYNAARARQRSLEKLATIRGTAAGAHQRDEFVFCCHSIWSNIYDDNEAIMEHVRTLNDLLANPLTEKEMAAYLKTAEKKRYKLTNTAIIDRLAITPEEQERIGFHPSGNGGNRYKRQQEQQARAEAKQKRNERILELWEDGARQEDIADEIGCSSRTVRRVIAEADAGRYKKIEEKLRDEEGKGKTQAQIAAELSCCRETISNHQRKRAQESQQEAEKAAGGEISNEEKKDATRAQNEAREAGEKAPEITEAAPLIFDELRLSRAGVRKSGQNVARYIRGGTLPGGLRGSISPGGAGGIPGKRCGYSGRAAP